MNWTSIRSTLKTVVESIDGLTHLGAVEWADTAAASHSRKYPRVDLSARAVIVYGDDEARIAVDDADERTELISGPRRFTWQVRVEGDAATGAESLTVAERIATRIRRRESYATLLAAELAVSGNVPIQVLDFEKDGRRYTVAVLDMFVDCASNEVDDSTYAGETIEQVSMASEYILDPDGGQNANQISDEVSSSS